jgi:hypothetical protein
MSIGSDDGNFSFELAFEISLYKMGTASLSRERRAGRLERAGNDRLG